MRTMNNSVTQEIFDQVPDYKRIVVTCTINGEPSDPSTVASELEASASSALERLRGVGLVGIPEISAWRQAFRAMNINPSKFRPALEALVRRVAKGETPVLNNALIDLGTAVSLRTLCPVGVHTVDEVAGNSLSLTLATGTETFTPFSGEPEKPEVGEVIYTADGAVLTRRWAWRQGRLGSVNPGLTSFAINIDALDPVDSDQVLKELLDSLDRIGVTTTETHVMSATSPTCILAWPR